MQCWLAPPDDERVGLRASSTQCIRRRLAQGEGTHDALAGRREERGLCEVMPLFIMLFHIACMVTFASHEKEMCVWFKENWVSAAFIYFSVYIHPLVLILASRFFWLCYRWRIPMIIYLFGINAIHIVYWNVFTTNEMVESNVVILVMTIIFYVYGFADKYFSGKGCQSLISRL